MSDLLDEHLAHSSNDDLLLVEAAKNKRFLNLIIDTIAYYVLAIVVGLFLGILEVGLGVSFFSATDNIFLDYLFGIVLITSYFTFLEYYFNGKSLGKMVTKTRALTVHGESLSVNDAMARSLSRLIPFEAFSFLGDGRGWHDSISKTIVIDDAKSNYSPKSDFV